MRKKMTNLNDDTQNTTVTTDSDELDMDKYKIVLPKQRGGKRSTSWKKGESGNKSKVGRKSKLDRKMQEIQESASGDPMKILEMLLLNFAELGFTPHQVVALCDKVMPYKAPKLSSVDKDRDADKNVEIKFNISSPATDTEE
jgi:hypothetical protein